MAQRSAAEAPEFPVSSQAFNANSRDMPALVSAYKIGESHHTSGSESFVIAALSCNPGTKMRDPRGNSEQLYINKESNIAGLGFREKCKLSA